jgi:8-oxo-dGTP pyrophosphatase MutT (NUDIX family)
MRKKIIAAGGVVFNSDGNLLMIFRRGKWDLPKGKLDKGEKIEDCAIREVKEETGLKKIHIKKFVGLTYHEYFDPHLQEDVVKETHWFEMHAPGKQKLLPQHEEDIEIIEWVDGKNLKEKLTNTYANVVEIIEKVKSSQ